MRFCPGVPGIVPDIMDKLPPLISTAEKMFASGPIKKQDVMQTAQLIAQDMGAVSTGGQADTWNNEIAPHIGSAIDLIVAAVNKVKPGTVDTSAAAPVPPTDDNSTISSGVPG